MNTTDDDNRSGRLFFAGLFVLTLISAVPHLVADDRDLETSVVELNGRAKLKTNEPWGQHSSEGERLLPVGPSAEQIHDFLFPPAPEEKVEAKIIN